jgi:hypothetical protein
LKKETIKQYTILYQYLLLLKEPTYIFLIQIFQHLSPSSWWDDFIEPVLSYENKENFKYLDISDLLNVFKMNWENIFKYLDKRYSKYKYNNEYKLVNKIYRIRTIVAHANEIDMSACILVDCLSSLFEYSKLIQADLTLTHKLELEWVKYQKALPDKQSKTIKEEKIRSDILTIIDDKVLLKAINSEALPSDIKLSIDRTTLRLQSMRTMDEIVGFFNGALRSERGQIVQEALRNNGLLGFEDIKDEINAVYKKSKNE